MKREHFKVAHFAARNPEKVILAHVSRLVRCFPLFFAASNQVDGYEETQAVRVAYTDVVTARRGCGDTKGTIAAHSDDCLGCHHVCRLCRCDGAFLLFPMYLEGKWEKIRVNSWIHSCKRII